jgi:DNA-binding protein H-NS
MSENQDIESNEDLELQKQIAEYEAMLNELKAKQREKLESQRTEVIENIRARIKKYGITAGEIFVSSRATSRVTPRVANSTRSVVAAKYRDPETGAVWSGRGKMPLWLDAQIKAGRERSEFLIQQEL